MNVESIAIVDCHAHFLDAELLTYPIFQRRSPGFEALVGDYSALPRRYLPEDYLHDAGGVKVVQTICAEFMSTDPAREVHWADTLSRSGGPPHGIIALVDFLSPDAEDVLNSYVPLRRVRAGTLGRPDEIATVAVFLASDESSFVSGIELFVDGGAAQI